MKTMTVGELKEHFSGALKEVSQGESIIVSFGRRKKKIAVLIPYEYYKAPDKRKLGLYEGRISCEFADDFKITDREFLQA